MIDVEEIKNITFRKSNFGGYKPLDVDSFLDAVQMSYEELQSENVELKKEINDLNTKLEKYQKEEESIRNAILGAQKLADASLFEADNKSKKILLDANVEADKILSDAKSEVDTQKKILWQIYMEHEKFRHKLIKSYEKQLDILRESSNMCNCKIFNSDIHNNGKENVSIDDKFSNKQEFHDTKKLQDDLKKNENESLKVDFKLTKENANMDECHKDNNDSEAIKTKVLIEMEDIDSGIGNKKEEGEDLQFGSKYRMSENNFGKGLYAGLFRRKK